MSTPATVPMLSPDGQVGDVPQERAGDAAKQGFKLAQDMLSPDGKPGVIPFDRVHDALAKGFQLKGADPKVPQPAMQERGVVSNEPIADDSEDRAHESASRTTEGYVKSMKLVAGAGGGGIADVAGEAEPIAAALAGKVVGHLKRLLGLKDEIPLNFKGLPGEQSAAEAAAAAAPPKVETSTLPNKDTQLEDEEDVGVPGPTEEKELGQKAADKYLAEHPEKRPLPQTVKRGANKGKPKTTRVFKDGAWHEVPVYK